MTLNDSGMVTKIVMLRLLIYFIIPIVSSVSDETSRFYGTRPNECLTYERTISGVDAEGLVQKLREIPPCNYNITIHLVDIDIAAFPNDSFPMVDSKIFNLVFKRINFPLLAPSIPDYLPFKNVRFNKSTVGIEDSGSLEGWRWEFFKDLPGKVTFYASNSELIYLRPEFGMIAGGKVTYIMINGCGLKWLGKNVFANFSELESLSLSGNSLQYIQRSHLPTYGRKLRVLNLGDNSLTYLPEDLCDGFELESARFDGNKLAVYGNELPKTSCPQVQEVTPVLDHGLIKQNNTVRHRNNSRQPSVVS